MSNTYTTQKNKISFYTLGCKVNQYETQAIKEIFIKNDYEVVDENQFAHVYVINSCSVTGISDRKTRQFLRKTKKINPDAITAVVGCYGETGWKELEKIDEVDMVLGTAEKSKIYDEVESIIQNKKSLQNNGEPKASDSNGQSDTVLDCDTTTISDTKPNIICNGDSNTYSKSKIIHVGGIKNITDYDDYGLVSGMDSRTRAYVKIEDGCDRFCSYCIIPHARGPVRSRPVDSILKEARVLIDKGYKELILTGINAALYGTDFSNETQVVSGLIELIQKINDLSGDFRIRLSSLEPTVINSEYVRKLIKIPKLCPHLHLSLQSGSNNILKSMGRRYNRDEYLDIIKVLKNKDPNYSITTDIIVGYPGETDANFKDSLDIVKEAGFSKVHVFKYSKRSGTPAAKMTNQIPGEIKNDRSRRLIEAAEQEAAKFLESNKGTTRQALVLEYNESTKCYKAITDNDIELEIDTNTYDDKSGLNPDSETYTGADISNSFINIVV